MSSKGFKQPNVGLAPEMQFFSQETIEAVEKETEQEKNIDLKESIKEEENEKTEEKAYPVEKKEMPKGYKLNPMYIEVKSKRIQLLMQPSLFKRIKQAAKKQGISVNEYCHKVLDEATD